MYACTYRLIIGKYVQYLIKITDSAYIIHVIIKPDHSLMIHNLAWHVLYIN